MMYWKVDKYLLYYWKTKGEEMKKLIAKNIGVDAGMIMVGDVDYLKDHPRRNDPKTEGMVFKGIKKGKYAVTWSIPDIYDGDIEGDGETLAWGANSTLVVTSGTIFVCDPCYIIGDKDGKKIKKNREAWLEWLKKTDYGRDINDDRAFIIDEMGGDGCYEVSLELTPLEK